MRNPSKFLLVYSGEKKEADDVIDRIVSFLEEEGVDYKLVERGEVRLGANRLRERADIMLVIGGDGTLLTGFRVLEDLSTPVLGINLGRGGYLCEVSPGEALESLRKLLRGEYELEEIKIASAYVNDKLIDYVINEVFIAPLIHGKVTDFTVKRGHEELFSCVADGMIIATPLGSTAYSYSAGGPGVDHRLPVLIITPINPINPIRSLVIPEDEGVSVVLKEGIEHVIVVDGNVTFKTSDGNVTVKGSDKFIRFVRIKKDNSFIRRLRKRIRL